MARLLRAVPEIPQEAEKTRDAIRFVRVAEEACGGDGLREALGLLHMPDAQSAAHALIALGDVAKNCDKEVLAAVKAAERAARDVVVLRCCAPGGGVLHVDQKAFLEAVRVALEREPNRELRAMLLLAYHKLRREPQPAR